MILEVSRKQDYIFSSNKLRENAERSMDIAYVTSGAFFREAAGELYSEEKNLVYSGGGHTVLQFEDRERATDFAKRVTEAVLRRYDGLELFVKQLPYDPGRTPGENLRELSKALERKKSLRRASFRRLSFGVEALGEETHRPVELSGDARPAPRREDFSGLLPQGWTFPTDFQALAGGDNFIAVVHIDGNAMGKRVSRIYEEESGDWDACRAALQAFSRNIQDSFEGAFRQMAARVAQELPDLCPCLPVRPVILAGDDVCFVSAGSIGPECARIFLEELSRMDAGGQPPYAACAGAALVHTKFPFHAAYDLAEELCSSAKRFGAGLDPEGRVSAMDWHIEFGQLKDSLSELREDYWTEDGARLELRPVAVLVPQGCGDPGARDYAFVRGLCRALQEGKDQIPRSKLKELRAALKQGEVESAFYLHDRQIGDLLYHGFEAKYQSPDARWDYYKRMLTEQIGLDKPAFADIGGEKRCLFFDAIEMMDHYMPFEEVEA